MVHKRINDVEEKQTNKQTNETNIYLNARIQLELMKIVQNRIKIDI